ncbi:MAG: SAM-dependent chlorinase/fluorinase [candidate division Zixibacteria bacterium]|nr:SAM-dependent chlorinase/fluorinase [candidate division Zixibacteria bacterium]
MADINTDSPIISLTTDFGLSDNYVGVIKGIITGLNSNAKLIDNSHDVPKYNINVGSYSIETAYKYYPCGTIHLVVVDPGVGTKRKAILIEIEDFYFIGPDNGIFSFLEKKAIKKIISLKNKKYFLKEISTSFHARDIFAPVAGFLSLGVSPDEFGPEINTIERSKSNRIRKTKRGFWGNIIYIDSFGNIVTSFRLNNLPSDSCNIYLGSIKIGRLRKTFGSVKAETPVAYINSSGYLEIAINGGSAADYFSVDYKSKEKILIATS